MPLQVSDQDQFLHYLLSRIAVQLGDVKGAWEYINTGRSRPGRVDPSKWTKVEDAAREAELEKPLPPRTWEKGFTL